MLLQIDKYHSQQSAELAEGDQRSRGDVNWSRGTVQQSVGGQDPSSVGQEILSITETSWQLRHWSYRSARLPTGL